MGRRSESLLMEDLIIECLKIYGFEVYYLPRSEVNKDQIFTEDVLQRYYQSYMIEVYLSSTAGFEGEGDLLTKFGVEIKDTATFIMARKRWDELIGRHSNIMTERPAEGDLLFFPLTNSFFEIKRTEMKDPFFQVGKLYTYKLECELFNYSAEEIDTGVVDLDDIAAEKSLNLFGWQIVLEDGERLLLENVTDSAILQEEYDLKEIDVQSQNDEFDQEIVTDGILDFTEKNPFGEVF